MLHGCTTASRPTCSFSELNGHSAVKESLHTFQNPITKPEQQLSCRLDNHTIVVQFLAEKNAHTGSLAHPASYSLGTLGSYSTDKVVRLRKWPFPSVISSAPQYIQLHLQSMGGITQSVWRLTMGWTVRRSNPRGSKFFRSRPDWPWGPPSLPYNGYWILPRG